MKTLLAVIPPLCLGFISGCGKAKLPLGEVRGRLTLDGQPVAKANISFEPVAGGRPSVGGSDVSGYYTLRYNASRMGALPGEHIVRISTFQQGFAADSLDENANDSENAMLMESIPGRTEEIPEKYMQNPLRVTVEHGSNTIDLMLDSNM